MEKIYKLKNILKKALEAFMLMLVVITLLKQTILYFCTKKVGGGVNIDINKLSIDFFKHYRPEDLNLNLAISKKKINKFYYQKELSLLNSIKKKQANAAFQGPILTKKIRSSSLNEVLKNSKFKNREIDFLDIDVEGADLEVLKSLNFKIYNPKLISVEIMPENLEVKKMNIKGSNIYKFLIKKNYKMIWTNKFSTLFKKV